MKYNILDGFVSAVILTVVIALSMIVAHQAYADSVGIHIGLWTEHVIGDHPDLNENNDLIQLSYYGDWDYAIPGDRARSVVTAGHYFNSIYKHSYFIGAGQELELLHDEAKVGLILAGVTGYGASPLIVPAVYFDYEYARLTIVGPVTSVGITYEF